MFPTRFHPPLFAFLTFGIFISPVLSTGSEDEPSPAELPRVLIIGDSISIGYTPATKQLLSGRAVTERIPGNAGHTGMGLANLDKWFEKLGGSERWEVIHFNWGLWDLCYRNPESKTQGRRDKVNGAITHTPEQYAANLDKLVERLKATGAKLIFATTTSVPEGEAGRKLGDDLIYNRWAVEVMEKHGVAINDLHAVMAGKMAEFSTEPGNVHFTKQGSEVLARKVALEVGEALGYTTLFDGDNFEGWEFSTGGWEIEKDGSMVCRMSEKPGKNGRVQGLGNIWSVRDYSDFDLSLSYKLSEGANSGIFYRANKDNPVQGGFEIQLMDNEGFQKTHGKKDARKLNGSFYDAKAPSTNPANPPGEWNAFQLTCRGPHIRVAINGIETFSVNVDHWDTAGTNPDGTTNKFKTALKDLPRTGRIGFQNHGQVVWFRDVQIRELD